MDDGIESGFFMGAASVLMVLTIIFFVHDAEYQDQIKSMTGEPKYDAHAQLITACNKVIAKAD